MNTTAATTARTLLLAPLLALGTSCATYTEQTEEALEAFRAGDVDRAVAEYEDVVDSAFLRGAETGTVLLAAGRWDEAREALEGAQAAVADLEGRALVSVTELGEDLSSWVLNDTTQP